MQCKKRNAAYFPWHTDTTASCEANNDRHLSVNFFLSPQRVTVSLWIPCDCFHYLVCYSCYKDWSSNLVSANKLGKKCGREVCITAGKSSMTLPGNGDGHLLPNYMAQNIFVKNKKKNILSENHAQKKSIPLNHSHLPKLSTHSSFMAPPSATLQHLLALTTVHHPPSYEKTQKTNKWQQVAVAEHRALLLQYSQIRSK